MSGFIATEKGVSIRMPSTANMMISSEDRSNADGSFVTYPSPFDFQIVRANNLQYGFFTRISPSEVVLNWCEPNVSPGYSNLNLSIDISGVAANTYVGTVTPSIVGGFLTAAATLDQIVAALNTLTGTTGATFSVVQTNGVVYLDCSGAVWSGNTTVLQNQMGLVSTVLAKNRAILCPDLRPFPYIDIVSEQLTYAQDVKDSSTGRLVRNVLVRWYFAEDLPEAIDAYGFPIMMGYKSFNRRRLYSPAKQIKWDTALQVGNLSFQVYDNLGNILEASAGLSDTNWQMTLQLSEV